VRTLLLRLPLAGHGALLLLLNASEQQLGLHLALKILGEGAHGCSVLLLELVAGNGGFELVEDGLLGEGGGLVEQLGVGVLLQNGLADDLLLLLLLE